MYQINVPRESANDNEVIIVDFKYKNGDWVSAESVVVSVEGEKTIYDVTSDEEGYIVYTQKIGDKVGINAVVAILSDEPIDDFEQIISIYSNKEDLDAPHDTVSESKDNFIESVSRKVLVNSKYTRVAVIGAGRGLDQLIDIVDGSNELKIVAAYDDIKFAECLAYSGIPILGKVNYNTIINDYNDGVFDALVISTSTNIKFRKSCYEQFVAVVPFVNMIHKTAKVSNSAVIGFGNIILANTVIAGAASVGNNNFISSMCNIEHHCVIRNHCTFGPAVIFSGNVTVCDEVKFGTGIFVEPFYSITEKRFIKSGSILTLKE